MLSAKCLPFFSGFILSINCIGGWLADQDSLGLKSQVQYGLMVTELWDNGTRIGAIIKRFQVTPGFKGLINSWLFREKEDSESSITEGLTCLKNF